MTKQFLPVKIHVKENKPAFARFNAQWTPVQIILDSGGAERHRIEGYLPVEDFLAQLELGLGKLYFQREDYGEAEKRFHAVTDGFPRASASPEACYWAGVSAYKGSNDAKHLAATAKALEEKYPDSEWARKASVWSP